MPEWNAELDVMKTIAEALASLPDDASRTRALRWAADHFAPSGGGPIDWTGPVRPSAAVDTADQQLEVPSAEELYDAAAAPHDRAAHEDDDAVDEPEDPVVHCVAVDALSVGADVFEELPTAFANDALTLDAADIEEPAIAVVDSTPRRDRLELDSLLRGFADEFERVVNEFQAELASTVRLCSVSM